MTTYDSQMRLQTTKTMAILNSQGYFAAQPPLIRCIITLPTYVHMDMRCNENRGVSACRRPPACPIEVALEVRREWRPSARSSANIDGRLDLTAGLKRVPTDKHVLRLRKIL